MEKENKRLIAYKTSIKDIVNGEYIKKSGWDPSYVLINNTKVSRINIMGIAILIDENNNLLIDDGSGNIQIRAFDPINSGLNIGDIILVIGRPREWNGDRYIVPEIVKKVNNPKWLDVRKAELKNEPKPIKKLVPPTKTPIEQIIKKDEEIIPPYEKIINLIRTLDTDNGADIDSVIEMSKIPDAEKIINSLIKEGEIFQVMPGRIKVM